MILDAPPPGCRCNEPALSVAAMVSAELRGVEAELCPIHNRAALQAREDRDARAELERKQQLDEAAVHRLDEQRAKREAKETGDNRRDAVAAIEDPLLRSLVAATGAPIPLNAPASAFPALAGMDSADGPDDAA